MTYKVRWHLPSGSTVIVNMDGNLKIGRYFKVWELANKSSKEDVKLELWTESLLFIKIMDAVRDDVGPIDVNSCYRTKSYNRQVGGDPNSAHLKTCAMDVPGSYVRYLQSFQKRCNDYGVKAAINKYKDYTHMEIFSDQFYGQTQNFVIRDKTR